MFYLVSFTGYAESVRGSAQSEALAISLESRESLFREGSSRRLEATISSGFHEEFVETRRPASPLLFKS